jgi:glycosyltransferase involved in cell wall biosynthesis
MSRPHILYVVSQPVRWATFEWVARGLVQDRFALSFLLLGPTPPPMKPYLERLRIEAHHVPCSGRHAVLGAASTIARYCRDRAVDLVHTHFMDACLAGLLGAWWAGVSLRLHTRHHAGPYPPSHRAPWGAWYDRWNNRLSTAIIAPSQQARRALLECDGAPARKVVVIPHGFDIAAFRDVPDAAVRQMRTKYGLTGAGPVVGVVARYERIKGIESIVMAFRKLLASRPNAVLVLANARGRGIGPIRRLLRTLPGERYREIRFEEEMPALYKTFDVFAHAPLRPWLEAFGQVYVEAMASGVPCVIAPAGIACEFLANGENALAVEPGRPDQIHEGIVRVLDDAALKARLTANGRRLVEERFGLARMLAALEALYARLLGNQEKARS